MNDLTISVEMDEHRVRLQCECASPVCTHWVWMDFKEYNDNYSHWARIIHPKCKQGRKGARVVETYDDFLVVQAG